MSLILDTPPELEIRLEQEATRYGLSAADYALRLLLNLMQPVASDTIKGTDGASMARRQRMIAALQQADQLAPRLEHVPPLDITQAISEMRDERVRQLLGN